MRGRAKFKFVRLGGLLAAVGLGVVLRVYIAVRLFGTTFDTATVGLMALNILGGERPLLYYGQSYMGAFEAYVAALLFALFGVSTTVLAMAPILFAVGWILGMFVLFQTILGMRAGLAAAFCTAGAGWYALWFSLGSYGGYAAVFCIGTWWLVLCARIARGRLSLRAEWGHALGLGVLGALGLWTNLQVLPYFATGLLVLCRRFVRSPSRRGLALRIAVALALGALGFVPAFLSGFERSGETLLLGIPSFGAVRFNLRVLLERCVPRLFLWPLWGERAAPLAVSVTVGAFYGLAACMAGWAVWRRWTRTKRGDVMIPVLFAVVFLALYLPHPRARLGAVRYLVPLHTTLTALVFAAVFGVPARRWRNLGMLLLGLWLCYNVGCAWLLVRQRAPDTARIRAARQRVVAGAEAAGLKHVLIVGSILDGHEGQVFSFYSHGRVRFISSFDERHGPSARSADRDDGAGLLCKPQHLDRLRYGLNAAGVAQFRSTADAWRPILYDFACPHSKRRAVPLDAVRVETTASIEGSGVSVVDQCESSGVSASFAADGALTLDLGAARRMDGLWMTPSGGARLPDSFVVETSADGEHYTQVRDVTGKALPAYVSGNRVYVLGYFVRRDVRFEPVPARWLRLRFLPVARKGTWQIGELRVFAHEGPAGAVQEQELDRLSGAIDRASLDFVVCDRWLSARLNERLAPRGGRSRAYPTYNPVCDPRSDRSRAVVPRAGLGVVVDRALRMETERLIAETFAGDTRAVGVTDFEHYTLFSFGPDVPAHAAGPRRETLVWNGHLLLRP